MAHIHHHQQPSHSQHADHSGHAHTGHKHGGHHHGSHVDPSKHGQAFAISIALNMVFVSVEFFYGFIANSTALMADAGHNLSDVLGLLLAWGAATLASKAPSGRYTYGFRSSATLAALANAMLLLLACGAIAWEAIARFSQPPAVTGLTVSLVAAVGIVINGVSAWLLMQGSKGDLNMRGAYLHMAADALVSLGVVLAGVTIMFTHWYWLDPVVSLVIVVVIVVGTWGLLCEAVMLAMHAVPVHIDIAAVQAYLRQYDGVTDIHDLHIWGMSTTENALTVHLVMPQYPGDAAIDTITHTLKERFGIQHSTLQVEQGTTAHACALDARSATATTHSH